jgi:plasmid stabilization system protein ParE
MADTHRVIVTREALQDLEEIAGHIYRESPQNAAVMSGKILDAIDGLGFMPRRFKVAGTSRKHRSPVHAVTVRPFIVYYRVEDSPAAVFILHVRHGARLQPRQFP